MIQRLITSRYFSFFVIFSLLMLYLGIQIMNGRFSMYDFEVYYRAAGRILQGENLYRPFEDGHYYFKYSPVSAIYFIPFRLVGPVSAKIIYWVLSSVVIAWSVQVSFAIRRNPVARDWQNRVSSSLLLFLVFAVFFEFEIHLGQVNIILLLFFLLTISAFQKGKELSAALCLSVGLFIKPFGLIFLPYLILRKRWRLILWIVLISLLLILLPLVVYGSFSILADQYENWIQQLLIEMGNKQDLLIPGNHTIFSTLLRWTPLKYLPWTEQLYMFYQILVLVIMATGVFLLFMRIKRSPWSDTDLLVLLVALVPLLAYTNINLFMFVMPLTAMLLSRFRYFGKVGKLLVIIGCIMLGFNWRDLWGFTLADRFEAWSLLSIGATILVATYAWLLVKRAKRDQLGSME